MELKVARERFSDTTTIGKLYIDGQFECYTLEDTVRQFGPHGEGKIMGQTAIPAGVYKVIINRSERFKKNMIRLLDVPFFTGILMHGGNTHEDTHGCILVGKTIEGWKIKAGTSTPAINDLKAKIQEALNRRENVTIEVVNGD